MSDLINSGERSALQWDFFISYTANDRLWAEWIAWQLESIGNRVLIQAWDFIPGSNWAVRMQQAVIGSDRTIALLSENYLKSAFGQKEWQAAQAVDPLGFKAKLVPIRISDCLRPGLLDQIVSFDLFGLDEAAAREKLFQQIEILRAGRAKPGVAPSFPEKLSRIQPAFPDPAPSVTFTEPAGRSVPRTLFLIASNKYTKSDRLRMSATYSLLFSPFSVLF